MIYSFIDQMCEFTKEKLVMKSVRADLIYTGLDVEQNKYLNYGDGRIDSLSSEPKGEVTGEYAVLTPAFVDAHSHIGLIRAGEPGDEREANEKLELIFALPDALDSVQMDDASFGDAMSQGVLYSCVVPGSLNVISGRSAVIRHWARDTNAALVARAGIKGAIGYNPISTKEGPAKRPNTRMGTLALLRAKLEEVKRKLAKLEKKGEEVDFSAEEDVLADILAGKQRLRVHVHKMDDIAALLRIHEEYGFDLGIEHAGDVHCQDTFDELKKRGIPVVYGPIDGFAYKVELKHRSGNNVGHLIKSGVQFGLMTDHPVTLSGSLLLQTRWMLRHGLSKAQAVGVITMNNARMLGIDDKLGSLEPGKWASFVGWNGDPFDISNSVQQAFGEGECVFVND
jgi:imidazolonepropionase-like amidohydrolase